MWPSTTLPAPIAPIESPFHQCVESKLHQTQGDLEDGFLWVRSIAGIKNCVGWNFTSSDNASNFYMHLTTTGCSPAVPDFSFDVWGNLTGTYASPVHPGSNLWNPGAVQVNTTGGGGGGPLDQQTWGNPTGPPALTPTSQTSAHDPTTGVVQTLSAVRNYLTDFGYAKTTAVYSVTGNGLLSGASWQEFTPAVYNGGTTNAAGAPANNNYDLFFDEGFTGLYAPPLDASMPYTTFSGAMSNVTPSAFLVGTSVPWSGWYATQGCNGPAYASGGSSEGGMVAVRSQFYLDSPDIFWFGKVIGVGQFVNSGSSPYDPCSQSFSDPKILARVSNPYGPAAPIGDLYVAMAIPGAVYEIPFPSDTPWVGGYDTTIGQCAKVYLFVGINPAEWAAANPSWTVV